MARFNVPEIVQLGEYNVFHDLGIRALVPIGYKKIHVHFVFDIKHDVRHKSCLVTNKNLKEPPLESIYSGVVSLRSL